MFGGSCLLAHVLEHIVSRSPVFPDVARTCRLKSLEDDPDMANAAMIIIPQHFNKRTRITHCQLFFHVFHVVQGLYSSVSPRPCKRLEKPQLIQGSCWPVTPLLTILTEPHCRHQIFPVHAS